MNHWEQLQWLASNGEPWAQERAQYALMITEAVNNGQISPGEYQELMRDLARMDALNEQSSNLEQKTMFVTAVYGVAQLV